MTLFSTACPLFWRNDRQQQIRRLAAAKMQAGGAAENGRRAVARIIMQERAATPQFVLEVRQLAAARSAIFIIFAADRHTDAVSSRNDNRRWPDLDVEFRNLTFFQGLFFVVRVVAPGRLR